MTSKNKIKIIKHKDAEPLRDIGDILYPFQDRNTTTTGDGWYTKFPEEFYKNKPYFPLTAIAENSWNSLIKLNINCFDFKEKVQYKCPYNNYMHFWCVPILIFSDNISFWTNRYKVNHTSMYLDQEWMKKFFPVKTKNGLPFTKIQRALLGPGYTTMTCISDGSCYLYDTLLALDNGDYLGSKVWIWFNK